MGELTFSVFVGKNFCVESKGFLELSASVKFGRLKLIDAAFVAVWFPTSAIGGFDVTWLTLSSSSSSERSQLSNYGQLV